MRKFEIKFDAICWECKIEIAPEYISHTGGKEYTAQQLIKNMVEFWTGWEVRLEEASGDYIKCFVTQLAKECFHIAYCNDYNLAGVTEEFEDMEGYCHMDGRHGIWITYTDAAVIGDEQFEVKEIAA